MIQHESVMLKEVQEFLDVHSQQDYIDCTLGGGGYTRAILEQNGPQGRVLAIDADIQTTVRTKKALAEFGKRLVVQCGNFKNVHSIAQTTGFEKVSGIVYDLGLSTDILTSSGRGFSFLADEPLDMRFSADSGYTAAELIASLKEQELANILWQFGEERFSRRIAKALCQARKKERITTTALLTRVIESAVPAGYRHGKIHCATRTYQALRMAVNDELPTIESSLAQSYELLQPGGRIVVVSFHSLEDRVVKNTFKQFRQNNNAHIITKKPIQPTYTEKRTNPKCRSAKLRCIQRGL
ncbi:MAG: 16S rRNA (cytosine(1402)-N(4))-methyltransferase RsmH [Patescibacteria group bacterium]